MLQVMPIIIEGPNGAGKSTLAKTLSEKFDIPISHATRPKNHKDAIDKAVIQYFNILDGTPMIYDRSHCISRIIYQNVSRYEATLYLALARLAAEHSKLIYCYGQGQRDVNKPHYTEELIKETEINQQYIRAKYEEILKNLPYIGYNFESDSLQKLLEAL